MFLRRLAHTRCGRHHQEHMVMLVVVTIACILLIKLVGVEHPADSRPLWDRVLASLLGMLQCFGLVIGVTVVLASVEVVKQTAARYQVRRIETKLARLESLSRQPADQACPANLARILRLLKDGNDTVRHRALATAYALLRLNPALAEGPPTRCALEQALLAAPGFARTLADTPPPADLLDRVTLGAKLGAGTAEKRLAPVTSDPQELAAWVDDHRGSAANPEIQVSVGYDTGPLPFLAERGRFLALYLLISTTDLKRFQALLRRPPRDPNAAYGLLIRGDVVEVRWPGQLRGHRLDYVFPLPVRLARVNLAGLFREVQLLNLGLLTACAQDACRVLLPGQPPAWLDERRQAVARIWRDFERRLAALLRRHDRHRDPMQIHRIVPADDVERLRAVEMYRLEECLYPQYSWVVPLYDPDTRWDRLLGPLRCVEAMLLHQGDVEDREVTRGVDFIQQVRQLGYQAAAAIDQVQGGGETLPMAGPLPPDPFIDPAEEEATRAYLLQVNRAIGRGEARLEDVPDPVTFRQALAYYDIVEETTAFARKTSGEVDP